MVWIVYTKEGKYNIWNTIIASFYWDEWVDKEMVYATLMDGSLDKSDISIRERIDLAKQFEDVGYDPHQEVPF